MPGAWGTRRRQVVGEPPTDPHPHFSRALAPLAPRLFVRRHAAPARASSIGTSVFTLTDKIIRSSFVDASRKEVSDLTLPAAFDEIDFSALDYLGWRDP